MKRLFYFVCYLAGCVGLQAAANVDPGVELFAKAQVDVLRGNQEDAVDTLVRIVQRHRTSPAAPQAQLKLAELYAANREYEAAFNAAQQVIDKFPASDLFTEALETQLSVVERVLDEYRQRQLKGEKTQRHLPKREAAREMLQSMLASGRFSPQAPRVQYRLAMARDDENNPAEAVREFHTFVANYPQHPLADDAAFQSAFIDYRLARENNRDQAPRDRARLALEDFLTRYPSSEKTPEARHLLVQLREWAAEKAGEVGRFYERTGRVHAAREIYSEALQHDPDASASDALKSRLERINQSFGEVRPSSFR